MAFQVQTRDVEGALNFFESVQEAFEYAEGNPSVWKVSFDAEDGSRCRFVRNNENSSFDDASWRFEPIIQIAR